MDDFYLPTVTVTEMDQDYLSDNNSDASYDMADDAMSLALSSNIESNGKAKELEKLENLSFEGAFTGPAGIEQDNNGEQTSILPSWISKIAGLQTAHGTEASQTADSAEERWLQSAEQITVDSDAKSVASNESGLGNLGTKSEENDDNFTDLQLDADVHSVRADVQTEAESILRILDGIHLTHETEVPREISSQLREHGRIITSFFADDIPFLKRKLKDRDEEVQKLIRKHAAECTRTNTATNEAMFKLQREKDSEIEALARRHHSQTQRLLHDFEYSEQRYKKQLSLLNEKIGVLKVDYPAYCGLKAEHQRLKHQLERHDAQSLVLQNMLQRYRDSKLQADAQLADASKQISQLRSDKAVHDGAVFQVFKLREMVHNLQTHLEGSKKETAETSRVLRRKEEATRQLAGRLEQQSSEHDRLQSIKKDLQVIVESLKADKDEVSQKNQVLEKENVECKQNIQNLQDRHAGFVVRLAKMRKMFTDTSAVLHKIDHQKENLQGEVEELKANNKQLEKSLETATEAKASLETAFNNTINKLETAAEPSYYDFYNKLLKLDKTGKLSKEFRNITSKRIDYTLEPFNSFAGLAKNYEPRTPAARLRAKEARGQFGQNGRRLSGHDSSLNKLSNIRSIRKTFVMECASLRDELAEAKAQRDHALTNTKCARDALAERDDELAALSKESRTKEKDNWGLRDALVTAWTQVEALAGELKLKELESEKQPKETILKTHSDAAATLEKPKATAEEARCLLGECFCTKCELSSVRNHLAIHQTEKEQFKIALFTARAETTKVQEKLEQANSDIARLRSEVTNGQELHRNLLRHTNLVKMDRGEVRKQLFKAQIELRCLRDKLSESKAEVTACKKELERAKEKLQAEDADNKMTQRNCLVLVKQLSALRERAIAAEKKVAEEQETHKQFREEARRKVRELIRRTGGVGISKEEILGAWVSDGSKAS